MRYIDSTQDLTALSVNASGVNDAPTIENTIKQPETYIASSGILTVKPTPVTPVTPTLQIVPILQNKDINGLLENPYTDIPKPVRTSSIPDSVWMNIVNSYNNQVLQRQQLTDSENAAIMEAARNKQAAADQEAAAAAKAASDKKIADEKKAAEEALIASQPALDDVTKAMQTVYQTMDDADKAKQALDAAGINATTTQIHEAAVTAIAQVVAVSNAADAGANLPVGIQTESANNAANALSSALESGVDIPQYIQLPDYNSNHTPLTDTGVITQTETAKVIDKVIAEGAVTDKQAAGNTSDTDTKKTETDNTTVKKLGWFDRLVNYIYDSLYTKK
jgi:hypothetical protein